MRMNSGTHTTKATKAKFLDFFLLFFFLQVIAEQISRTEYNIQIFFMTAPLLAILNSVQILKYY